MNAVGCEDGVRLALEQNRNILIPATQEDAMFRTMVLDLIEMTALAAFGAGIWSMAMAFPH